MQIVPKLGMIYRSFLEFHGEIILDKCKENSAKPRDDEQSGDSNSIINQALICKGWFLPSNTYDCGSFVVN